MIGTLGQNGEDVMGPHTLACHYPDSSIVNGSLLAVEKQSFCGSESQGRHSQCVRCPAMCSA